MVPNSIIYIHFGFELKMYLCRHVLAAEYCHTFEAYREIIIMTYSSTIYISTYRKTILGLTFCPVGVRVKALIAGILRYIIGIFPSQEFLLLIIVILHRNSVVQTPDITTLSLYSAVYCVLDKNTVSKENTRHYG